MSSQTRASHDARPGELVSVVIPFFNRVEVTLRAVTSALGQTYSNVEVLVVDDASTCDVSVLKAFCARKPNVTYIGLRRNVGPGAARNIGIRASRGHFVAFLDSDDTWEPNKLSVQVSHMIASGWSFSHTSYYRHDGISGRTTIVRSGRRAYRFPWLVFHCGIATPSVVVERSLLSDLSFRSDLRAAEDTLLWLALCKRTILYGIDNPLTHVFIGDRTAALNPTIQAEALRLLAKDGLAGRHGLLAVHAAYRAARHIQRGIAWRLCRVGRTSGTPSSARHL